MDVSENGGTPKSSILTGFSIINHPFWGTPIFGNTHTSPKQQQHAAVGVASHFVATPHCHARDLRSPAHQGGRRKQMQHVIVYVCKYIYMYYTYSLHIYIYAHVNLNTYIIYNYMYIYITGVPFFVISRRETFCDLWPFSWLCMVFSRVIFGNCIPAHLVVMVWLLICSLAAKGCLLQRA